MLKYYKNRVKKDGSRKIGKKPTAKNKKKYLGLNKKGKGKELRLLPQANVEIPREDLVIINSDNSIFPSVKESCI